MAKYHFNIRKADHQNSNGSWDLHVHIYYSEKGRAKLLGRYRLPTLEPIYTGRELNGIEINMLKDWLAKEEQLKKLKNCLKDTIFNLHEIAQQIPKFSSIITEEGETYITVKIPVSKRLS
jgi:hypothetical protein